LTQAWTSTDATAIGSPLVEGTVVTYDAHTMRGRDALTGEQTWSYTRTDRTMCTAIQSQSVAIAVFKLHGNCDELTALDATTGTRRWTRTLDKDGAEFNGPASYQVDGSNVMFVSHTSIYAVSIGGTADQGNGGLDYWTFHHVGCTINGAVLGTAGALISQTCHGEDCNGHKFCGDGTQLLLRDGTTGYDDKSTTNPDIVKWNDIGTDLVPTSAGQTVTARDPDGATLRGFDVKTGKQNTQLALTGDSGSQAPSGFVSGTDGDAIWIGARLYALTSGDRSFRWQVPATATPTVAVLAELFKAPLALTTTRTAVVGIDPATGKVVTRYRVPVPVTSSMIYPLGTGLLVAGPHTVVYR
jgi:outer membrane protein assembly factor BamB